MHRRRLRNSFAAILAFGAVASCGSNAAQQEPPALEVVQDKPKLGLFTTLPIYWGEGGMDAILAGASETDWVRTELETQFELIPLDTLEPEALEGLDRVLLAQPRPLAPSENVAFDDYLSRGGVAVIIADPMLTRHSEFGFGDRRRPQDVVVLSPILSRLGVRLLFDEGQSEGERSVTVNGQEFPVNLAGRFVVTETGSDTRECSISESGLLAFCRNGQGEALIYADAALLDWEGDDPIPKSRKNALWGLLQPFVSED